MKTLRASAPLALAVALAAFACAGAQTTPAPSPLPVAQPAPLPSVAPGASPSATPFVNPTPSPTPPPITVSPPGGVIAVGASQVFTVSAMGAITAVAQDPTIVQVTVDQNARTVTLAATKPGATVVTISDSRGLTRALPVRTAYNAGVIATSGTLEITGQPASADFIREQASLFAKSLAQPRTGAVVISTPAFVKSAHQLQQDDVADVDVPVLIQGNGYFSVEGTTRVRVENVAAPRIAPNLLMVSDFPERLTENGLLFTADLASDTPSRFLYFHYNPPGQPDRRIVLRAENRSSEPATVQFISGAGGPTPNEMEVGHTANKLFLVRLLQNEGRLIVIPAKSSLNLVEHDIPAGNVSANLLQLRVLNGASVHLTLFAQNASSDPQESLQSSELLVGAAKHARGVYRLPEFHFARRWSTTDPYLELPIGQIPVPNTIEGEALSGDYGVLQSFVITVQNPQSKPQAIAIYENPRGGGATGTYIIDGVLVQSHRVPAFSRYKIRQYVVPAKGFVRVTIVTMPEGGSSYPLNLIFAPDDGSVAPGAPGSPVY